jgi:rubrerythrin
MTQQTATLPGTESPVEDATYNLLQALTSKLEAIEAYEMYASDDPENVFGTLIEDERRHASQLYEALRRRMGGS